MSKYLTFITFLLIFIYNDVFAEVQTPVNDKTYSYVVGLFGQAMCTPNLEDGKLTNCGDSGPTFPGIPGSIVFNTSGTNTYAYITAYPGVTKCALNPNNGMLANCQDSGASQSSNAASIVFNTSGSNTYAYISYYNNKINKCTLESEDGTLSNCIDSGGYDFAEARGIAFNTIGYKTYAYITDYGNNKVTKCTLNSEDGSLANCQDSGGSSSDPFLNPQSITFNTSGSNTYAYVGDYQGQSFIHPERILHKCSLDPSNGNFDKCEDSSNRFFFYAIQNISFQILGSNKYAYIVDNTRIIKCLVDLNGMLTNCQDSDMNPRPTSSIFGMAFHSIK